MPTSTPSEVTTSECGVSSEDDHSMSTSPDGSTRRTAPFGAPVRRDSGGRGVAIGVGAAACGAITAKFSVTVTSAVGVAPGGAGCKGVGARMSSRSLPSTTAAYRLPSLPRSRALTSRYGESWRTKTFPAESIR